MDSQRNLLLIALLFVSFMIWQAWQTDNAPQPVAQTTQQTSNTATGDAASSAVPASGQGKLITVNTDVLSLTTEQIRPAPEFAVTLATEYLTGLGSLGERMLILVDIEKLLSSEEMSLVDSVAKSA